MTAPALTVHVNRVESAPVVSSEEVERAVNTVADEEGVQRGEISVTFVDTPTIASLNQSHLQRHGPTDVISFNLGAADEPLGDVYICAEVAQESADEYGVELKEEILRLVVHGVLHLFGFEHPEGADREQSTMFRRQESILSRLL